MSSIFFAIISICNSQWISPESLLPRASHEMAIGSYNHTIFLLGGSPSSNDNQLVSYNIDSDVFVDHGQTALSDRISCYSQCSTQIDNQIYIITYYSTQSLSMYNMATNTFTPDWVSPIPTEVNHHACLASSTPYLYVVGGYRNFGASPIDYHYLDTIQILQLETKQWTEGPVMLTKRGRFSCIVYQEELYAIGGVYGDAAGQYLSSIEQINIQSKSSKYIGALDEPIERTRAVIYQDLIWIIGGYYRSNSDTRYYRDTVHIIDPITANVSLSPHRLIYPVYGVAAIAVNNVIYAFGGHYNYGSNEYLSTWMKYESALTETITIYITRDVEPTGLARLGTFECDGFSGHTLEHEELKINTGIFRGELYFSPKFDRTVIYLNDDDTNRQAIEIHAGNYVGDTEGCILVGESRGIQANTGNGAVWNSVVTLEALIELCEGKEIVIEVHDEDDITTTDAITTDVMSTDTISTDTISTYGSADIPTAMDTVNINHGNAFSKSDCIWLMFGSFGIVMNSMSL